MVREIVMVDTNIWMYAYREPIEESYLEIHRKAESFLQNLLKDISVQIALTSYQIGEILDILRKAGISEEERRKRLREFEKEEKFLVKDLLFSEVKLCAELSISSSIHIYDYLVTVPLKGTVTKIYSADKHLSHRDFADIAEVINPISPWTLTEGRRPEKEEIE
jgi:predicted nucleic acid-binding protein